MINGDENQELREHLETKIKEYSDEEILSILRKFKLYEPVAQEIALEEAMRRNLIQSEQELVSFGNTTEKLTFSLFPLPAKAETIFKIIRSISRSLLIAGVIPVVFGILKFQVLKYTEGSALVLAGLIWMSSSWMIYIRQDRRFWAPMLVIALLSAAFVARILLLLKGLRTMDYVVPGVLFLVVFYCIFYLRFLDRKSVV